MSDTRTQPGPDCAHGCKSGWIAWCCTSYPECECDCYYQEDADEYELGTWSRGQNCKKSPASALISLQFTNVPVGFIVAILQTRADFTIEFPQEKLDLKVSAEFKGESFEDITKALQVMN